MAIERKITKQLGGVEDLTLGNDTEEQLRNGTSHTITQVSGASLPNDAASGSSIKAVTATAQSTADGAATVAAAADAKADTAITGLVTKVEKTSDTGSAIIPSGTTAQRDISPENGYTRINTTTNNLEVYSGGAWVSFGNIADLVTKTTTHDMLSDADYTATAAENLFGILEITDTSVFLTTSRNVLLDTSERLFFAINSTAEILTYKTVAGTGEEVKPGERKQLLSDGTNIILPESVTFPLNEFYPMIMGNASKGELHYTTSTVLDSGLYDCSDLTIDSGVVISATETEDAYFLFVVQGTCTYAGVINLDGVGALGGQGAADSSDYGDPGGIGELGGGGGEGGSNNAQEGGGGDTHFLLGGPSGGGIGAGTAGEACAVLISAEEYIRERGVLSLSSGFSLGGGGGGGGSTTSTTDGGDGGNAGGGVVIICDTFDFQSSGSFTADGNVGQDTNETGGGGGGGGSLVVFAKTIINNLGAVSVTGGIGGTDTGGGTHGGGNGGDGYMVLVTPTSRSERTS